MKRDDLLWLAGFLEGEGCFAYYVRDRMVKARNGKKYPHHQRQWIITASSTHDRDVIERVAALLGTSIFRASNGQWVARTADRARVIELAKQLQPLMGARRQAKIQGMLDADAREPRGRQDLINKY